MLCPVCRRFEARSCVCRHEGGARASAVVRACAGAGAWQSADAWRCAAGTMPERARAGCAHAGAVVRMCRRKRMARPRRMAIAQLAQYLSARSK
eukprot:11555558-Alexandrium_andersonii.AAC.1